MCLTSYAPPACESVPEPTAASRGGEGAVGRAGRLHYCPPAGSVASGMGAH
jgi:hypothetical protein